MSDLQKSFNERAPIYDKWVHGICPHYEEALDALSNALVPSASFVLELGCGTGILSLRMLRKYPKAQLTVVDISPAMLEVSRGKLKEYKDRINFIEKDFNSFDSKYRFDIIVSSLAVHHLDRKNKERLFETAFSMLEPRGCFYLFDCVQGASRDIENLNHKVWMEYMRSQGVPENEIGYALERQKNHDIRDTLFLQFELFKKIGFVDIDVIWKYYGIAVFGARKY